MRGKSIKCFEDSRGFSHNDWDLSDQKSPVDQSSVSQRLNVGTGLSWCWEQEMAKQA